MPNWNLTSRAAEVHCGYAGSLTDWRRAVTSRSSFASVGADDAVPPALKSATKATWLGWLVDGIIPEEVVTSVTNQIVKTETALKGWSGALSAWRDAANQASGSLPIAWQKNHADFLSKWVMHNTVKFWMQLMPPFKDALSGRVLPVDLGLLSANNDKIPGQAQITEAVAATALVQSRVEEGVYMRPPQASASGYSSAGAFVVDDAVLITGIIAVATLLLVGGTLVYFTYAKYVDGQTVVATGNLKKFQEFGRQQDARNAEFNKIADTQGPAAANQWAATNPPPTQPKDDKPPDGFDVTGWLQWGAVIAGVVFFGPPLLTAIGGALASSKQKKANA